MAGQLSITYRATGGRPPVDLDLRLEADGTAALVLATSSSIPTERVSRVGTFGGPAPTGSIEELRSYVVEHSMLDRGGTYGQDGPDTPSRFLALDVDGREVEFRLSGLINQADIEGFEAMVQAFALRLTDQPIAAVEGSAELATAAGKVTSAILLRSIGTAPVPVLLPLRARIDFEAQMTLPSGAVMPMALATVTATPESLMLGSVGAAPAERSTELPPHTSYRLVLPPIELPESALPVVAIGSVTLASADSSSRRDLTLLTAETPLR